MFGLFIKTAHAQAPEFVQNVADVIQDVADVLGTIIDAVATIFLLYGAYLYLSAAGNEEKVSKAHKVILWAAIGYGVAFAIDTQTFQTFVQGVIDF
jgi:hypothetical protein